MFAAEDGIAPYSTWGSGWSPWQDEAPILLAPLVDRPAHAAEQFRPLLSLVEHRRAVARYDLLPSCIEPRAFFGRLQIEVTPGQGSRERRLTALARADESDGGKPRHPLLEQTRKRPVNHVLKTGTSFPIFKNVFPLT